MAVKYQLTSNEKGSDDGDFTSTMSHFRRQVNCTTALDAVVALCRAYAMKQAGDNEDGAKAAIQAATASDIVGRIRKAGAYVEPTGDADRLRIAINVYAFISSWVASGARGGISFPAAGKSAHEWYMETGFYYPAGTGL